MTAELDTDTIVSTQTNVHLDGKVAEHVKVKKLTTDGGERTYTIRIGDYPSAVVVFVDRDELKVFADILTDAANA